LRACESLAGPSGQESEQEFIAAYPQLNAKMLTKNQKL